MCTDLFSRKEFLNNYFHLEFLQILVPKIFIISSRILFLTLGKITSSTESNLQKFLLQLLMFSINNLVKKYLLNLLWKSPSNLVSGKLISSQNPLIMKYGYSRVFCKSVLKTRKLVSQNYTKALQNLDIILASLLFD